jgi:hypothetical protein
LTSQRSTQRVFEPARANPPPDRLEGSRAFSVPLGFMRIRREVLNHVWGGTMNRTRYLVAVCLLAFSVQAKADGWLDDDINDILAKVRTMFTTITGDVKDTAQDLNRQLTSLTQKGATVKEHVEDALDLAAHRRTPFLDFVNGPNGRCGEGSTCLDFRLDLENFVLDMADLLSAHPETRAWRWDDCRRSRRPPSATRPLRSLRNSQQGSRLAGHAAASRGLSTTRSATLMYFRRSPWERISLSPRMSRVLR